MKKYKEDNPLSLSKTIVDGLETNFNLSDLEDRQRYFEAKAGKEIKALKEHFKDNTFIAYWLGKKNSGKGTYSKLMMEVFGKDSIAHISVGDVVRSAHGDMMDETKKNELLDYLSENYRGYISLDKAIDSLLGRDTTSLLPTEFILALIKREIDRTPRKIVFIDGFPRELDQVSYALFFRDLIDYRKDPDVFIAIDIPEFTIDERMKNRVVCPQCHTPRSLKLLTTPKVGYDKDREEFYLICDNPTCDDVRMGSKEGDNAGIESIRDRLELDEKLIETVFSLHGVSKVLLRNSIPVKQAKNLVDSYEITPEYSYELESNGNVKTIESEWIIKDDEGQDAYSLLAPPVVVSLIKQLANLFLKTNEK